MLINRLFPHARLQRVVEQLNMSSQETAEPNKESPDNASNWQVYKRLLVYLKPLKGIFILSLIGNAIYAGASALMPKSLDYVVTAVESPTDQDRLFVPALIVGIFALRGVGTFLGGYYIAKVGRQIVHTLRTEIFNNILTLPNRFFDERKDLRQKYGWKRKYFLF